MRMRHRDRDRDHGERQTPEEYDVRRALKDYTDDWPPDDPRRLRAFIPTARLYETYRTYINSVPQWGGEDPPLTLIKFAVVLRRVFPELTLLPRAGKAFRSYDRKRVWGIVGLWGPGCILTRGTTGRPDPDDDPEPEPELARRPTGYPFVRPCESPRRRKPAAGLA